MLMFLNNWNLIVEILILSLLTKLNFLKIVFVFQLCVRFEYEFGGSESFRRVKIILVVLRKVREEYCHMILVARA